MSNCRYCTMDYDDYVLPLEKNGHVFLYPSIGAWSLQVNVHKWSKQIPINYCPICGRDLRRRNENGFRSM